MMKRNIEIEDAQFDNAATDAFRNAPSCGEFGTIDELSRRYSVNDILRLAAITSAARNTPPTENRLDKRRYIHVAAAIVMVIGLGGILAWRMSLVDETPTPPAAPSYFGEFQSIQGAVFVDGRSAYRHAPLPVEKSLHTANGNALLRLPTGIDWWISSNGHGKLNTPVSNQLQIAVLSGEHWFRVDPKRRGPTFSVLTPQGRISVTGTIFVVQTTDDDITVTLIKGSVHIQDADGQPQSVSAGYSMQLGNGKTVRVSNEEYKHLQQQLAALNWNSKSTPKSVAQNEISQKGDVAQRPKTDTAQNFTPKNPKGSTDSHDLHQLHAKIQAARKKSDWPRVASLYSHLIRSAPGSDAAIVSRVSLGDVYLTRLHRHQDALTQYSRYIHTGQQMLLPEASYGRCRALLALRRPAAEQRCLKQFIGQFPTAFQVADARARLVALQTNAPQPDSAAQQ